MNPGTAITVAGLWHDLSLAKRNPERAADLERDVRVFLQISAALEFSLEEERTLLDLTARELAQLRLAPANAFQLGGVKLERRVTYAIPILKRMVAAIAC